MKRLLNKIGLDGAIFWSTINKGFGFVKGPLNIYFVIKFLTLEQQGTWYTFTNLSALTILADLGFAGIITQYVSHEYAYIKFNGKEIEGNDENVDRFFGLIKFAIKTYAFVIILAEFVLIISGFLIFNISNNFLILAWVLYTLSGSLGLIVSLLQSIYQGVDKVKIVQQNALYYSIFSTSFIWILLFLKFNIWSLAIGSLLALPIVLYLLINDNILFWKNIIKYKVKNSYNFYKEVLPLQAKYAISFASSYLISYLYVPTIFKTFGGQLAGKFGMTMSVLSVVSIVSGNWLMTKTPKMNMLVAKKNYKDLDNIFFDSFKKSVLVFSLLNFSILILIYFLNYFHLNFANRLLDFKTSSILIITNLFALISSFFSTYLRCFKKEPFLIVYLINGLFVVFAIYFFLVYQKNINNFLISICIFTSLILFPISIYLFKLYRKKYINE